jgi:glycosyltransferase involved in cell wall biosynthesis
MDKNLKILHLVDHIKDVGNGITNVVVDLSTDMAKQCDSIGVFSSGGDFSKLLEKNNVLVRVSKHKNIYAEAQSLAKCLRVDKYNLVHIHTPRMALLYFLSKFFYRENISSLTTIHNSFQKSSWALTFFKNVVCLSQSDVNKFSKLNKISRFYKIINGTLGSQRSPSKNIISNIEPRSEFIFTTVANMCHRKGIDILLNAFSKVIKHHPRCQLNLVGDGDEIEKFKSLATELGLNKNTKFWGKLKDPKKIIITSDVFILASRRDPCPLVIFEAMECGVPIIGSNADGIPEQLGHGEFGIIFEDESDLTKKMLALIDDLKLLASSKIKSMNGVTKFNLSNTTAHYISTYKDILRDN